MQSTFRAVFGNNAFIKLLDFLIQHQIFDYSMTEMARHAGIAWSTMNTIWPRLVKNNILIYTRTVGRAKMYKLNTDNPAIQRFLEFVYELSKQAVKKEIKLKIE